MTLDNSIMIKVQAICSECRGNKTVYDPYGFWAEAMPVLNRLSEELPPIERNRAWDDWCEQHGYDPLRPLPPEEADCDNCNGTGRAWELVTIQELKRLLAEA